MEKTIQKHSLRTASDCTRSDSETREGKQKLHKDRGMLENPPNPWAYKVKLPPSPCVNAINVILLT